MAATASVSEGMAEKIDPCKTAIVVRPGQRKTRRQLGLRREHDLGSSDLLNGYREEEIGCGQERERKRKEGNKKKVRDGDEKFWVIEGGARDGCLVGYLNWVEKGARVFCLSFG